jgi:hypothetical protein
LNSNRPARWKTSLALIWQERGIGDLLHALSLGSAFVLAASIRFWAAPLSTGPDVAQFWAFADTFRLHGLNFYQYASALMATFPFYAWGFVYPPVWLLILRLCLLAVPSSAATALWVDTGWRLAMKTPLITADLAIGALLYWAVPGSKWRKLAFASLWLFHPTAWYESAVFGQFDAIAAAFLLASVILLLRGRDRLAFLFAGLALMTKQHTLLPIGMMVIASARYLSKRRLLTNGLIAGGVVVLLSIPFLLTGDFQAYAYSLFSPGQSPDYQFPLCFALSGPGSLLTYLHNTLGWSTLGLIKLTIPVLVAALIVVAILSYKRSITPLQGALAGFLVFISLFYRVNYQYLVIYIPLAILLATRTPHRGERIYALALAVLPAVWVWLSNIPWWFYDLGPVHTWVIPLLARFGLPQRNLPDSAFVTFAVVLMCLSLTYVVLLFTRWRQQGSASWPGTPGRTDPAMKYYKSPL